MPAVDRASVPEQQIVQAASTGDVDRISDLLTRDPALANFQGDDHRTPLHFAAAHGQNGAVEYLLEMGANPAITDENGLTPQGTAFQQGHPDTAKLIGERRAGADKRPK